MCAGIVRKDEIVRGIAPNVGDVFVLMGGRTGRDGIHGVTFASEELTSASELESRPAVQVGDPFTKKQVMEATMEALEKVNVQGLKDLGGGGLTCCISEMADKSGNGALMELTKVPLREEGMTPYEIMLSESQERMVFVVHRQDVDGLLEIFDKYELPYAVIGQVTNNQNMVVTQEGEVIANIPTELLADPPIVKREAKKPEKNEKYLEIEDGPVPEALLELLSSQNIASKNGFTGSTIMKSRSVPWLNLEMMLLCCEWMIRKPSPSPVTVTAYTATWIHIKEVLVQWRRPYVTWWPWDQSHYVWWIVLTSETQKNQRYSGSLKSACRECQIWPTGSSYQLPVEM
ncbi:hypothetical protein GCM10025861_05480 [Methanobacterium petrolearium]|nr:hypothetical protein GCM10025861_05480 [Methanobacterium petrolearium]